MNSLVYSLLHIKRHPLSMIGILIVYVISVLTLISVQIAAESRQLALDSMIESLPVNCIATNPQGTQTDNLTISSMYYNAVLDRNTQFSRYIKSLCLKTQYECTMADGQKIQLVGITREDAAYELVHETTQLIQYDTDYNESMLETNEPVCIISSDLKPYVAKDSNGMPMILLSMNVGVSDQHIQSIAITFFVVGEAKASSVIYCPWIALKDKYESTGHDIITAQSMSFLLSDNLKLEEFRDFSKKCFVESNYLNPDDSYDLALTIYDAQYLKLTQASRKNLTIIQFIQPILFFCALFIGSFVASLQIRSRKNELCILLGMGTKRSTVLSQCLVEYLIICLTGTILVYILLGKVPISNLLIVFAFFIAGIILTITHFLNRPLIAQIRELEE